MNFKRFGLGKQLINPSVATYGKYIDANGVEQTSSSGLVNHTEYIPVIANYAYTISYDKPNVSGNTIAISWYDNNKNFIIRDSEFMPFELGRYKFTKTVPNNAAFAIVNFTYFTAYTETQNTNNYIFAIGESQLPYEPYGNTWVDTTLRQYKTATDTITTLPADVYADGTNATVGLVGNMSQTGTPTPQNPIQPSETGERTGNLFDETAEYVVGVTTQNYTISGLDPNKYYTCSTNFARISGVSTASLYFGGGASNINGVWSDTPRTFKPNSSGEIIVYIRYKESDGAPSIIDDVMAGTIWVMVNEGSTPLPYGYKLTISSASTATPVYLGEVESTRKIKKLVLTGEESITPWTGAGSGYFYIYTTGIITFNASDKLWLSNQYSAKGQAESWGNYVISCNPSVQGRLVIKNTDYPTVEEFKAYLAQQYAAGTPVTIWYVLAEPTTAIVNEPIRKIGTYADTVSGITIPTITGKDTFDVLTTLKPSEVSLAYTGWHDASVKEKSRNLFDYSTITTGYRIQWANGNLYADDTAIMSDYIPVDIRKNYMLNGSYYIIGYDVNKNYAGTYQSGSSWQKSVTDVKNSFYINDNSNVSFVKILSFSASTPISSTTMLNEGSTALPYEPYWK